jgi:hypothetical protein
MAGAERLTKWWDKSPSDREVYLFLIAVFLFSGAMVAVKLMLR